MVPIPEAVNTALSWLSIAAPSREAGNFLETVFSDGAQDPLLN